MVTYIPGRNPLSDGTTESRAPMIEERHYARVAAELNEAPAIAGLWAKCFAESGGDERRAKALYLHRRATQLLEQDAVTAALLEQQRADERRQAGANKLELKRQSANAEDAVNARRPLLQRHVSREGAGMVILVTLAVAGVAFVLMAS